MRSLWFVVVVDIVLMLLFVLLEMGVGFKTEVLFSVLFCQTVGNWTGILGSP